MKPALSVIFFTTLSGLGYGLAFWLSLDWFLAPERAGAAWFGGAGMAAAIVLIVAGLLSSTLHLGRPERAWRAFSQWRTSWLSREGVAAVVSMPVLALIWLGWVIGASGALWAILALLGALLAIATVYCTGMIYQSLKPIAAWTSKLTTLVYLLYAAMTGAFAAAALASWFGFFGGVQIAVAILLAGMLLFAKIAYWRRAAGDRGLTPEDATGLGRIGRVRQLEAPHQTDNYITREMGFRVARRHAEKLRLIATGVGMALPALLGAVAIATGGAAPALLTAAAAAALVGAIVERWLFFAEARHAVTAFYGAR